MRVLLRGALALLPMLALAFGLRAAEAAPPEVTASENPVVIPFGQDTKTITLTWSLTAGTPFANLTVTESGTGAPVLAQAVTFPPGTGTVPLTVTYGKTYSAQLVETLTGVPLGTPLTITAERLDANLGVAVRPHSTWAQFTVTTDVTAIVTIEASTKPPKTAGEWSNPADVDGFSKTTLPTTHWTSKFPTSGSLTPNTRYHYVVRAHLDGGNEQIKTGSFKTLRQQVTVNFTDLTMIDDSDDLSACDCFFWFKAGDAAPQAYGDIRNDLSISSGSTVHPNRVFNITNPPAQLKLGVFGTDDDTDIGQFCAYGTGASPIWSSYWTSDGSDGCHDWAASTATLTVPAVPVGSTQRSAVFGLPVYGSFSGLPAREQALKFTVSGTLTVTEVP